MRIYLLDTDTFSLFLQNDVSVLGNVVQHLTDHIVISIITVQEIWDGWMTVIHRAKTSDRVSSAYLRLADTLNELRNWSVVTFPESAISSYSALKRLKLNVGSNDLKIAAIAIEIGATVVTRNLRDFTRIPGVVCEPWTGGQ